MNKLLQDKKTELEELCKKFSVFQLEVFGSIVKGNFDAKSSDIDFLVEFNVEGIDCYADCYFGLLEALESLFPCPIELIVISSLKNPYFIESIEKSRELLYAA